MRVDSTSLSRFLVVSVGKGLATLRFRMFVPCKLSRPSEGAPVPVPRHAQRNVGYALPQGRARQRGDGSGGRRAIRRRVTTVVVGRSSRRGGAGPAVRAAAPLLELDVAVGAGAAVESARVILGLLVEGDLVSAVGVAEDVAAPAAVVAAGEVAKGAAAGRVIAYGRVLIRLGRGMTG